MEELYLLRMKTYIQFCWITACAGMTKRLQYKMMESMAFKRGVYPHLLRSYQESSDFGLSIYCFFFTFWFLAFDCSITIRST